MAVGKALYQFRGITCLIKTLESITGSFISHLYIIDQLFTGWLGSVDAE